MSGLKKVILAKPRGFCAGVVRAIETVEAVLQKFGPPIYVRKEIVHNPHVVGKLRKAGAVFVDTLDDVPHGAPVVFSAHGVAPAVRLQAQERGLHIIDATCPLVTKVHLEAQRFARQGYSIILIGHKGHEEIEGTMGETPQATQLVTEAAEVADLQVPEPDKVVYLTQTTLSLDDVREIVASLRARFPMLRSPAQSDICYATQNRQFAVKELATHAEVIFVVGAENSSNSRRLREVARAAGARAYLINHHTQIQTDWLRGVATVGITAGASAPEEIVQEVVDYCRTLGADEVVELEVVKEDVVFALPAEVTDRHVPPQM